jgi:Tfp pilus assembly protein PilN
VRVLNELSTRTPDRLWLTSLSTKGKTILLQGQSLDNELVALFLRSLGDSEYFANVDLDSTKLGSEKGGLKLITFRIRAEIVNPKGQAATSAKKTAKRA